MATKTTADANDWLHFKVGVRVVNQPWHTTHLNYFEMLLKIVYKIWDLPISVYHTAIWYRLVVYDRPIATYRMQEYKPTHTKMS